MANTDKKIYRPAWRSFYKNIALMILAFVAAIWLSCIQVQAGTKNIIWAISGALIILALVDMWLARKFAEKAKRLDEYSAMRNYLVIGVALAIAVLISFVNIGESISIGILWICTLAIILALFLDIWVARMSVKICISPEEIAYDRGILHPKSTEVSYSGSLIVDVDRSIWQCLLNVGTLSIASSGTSGYEVVVHNLADPKTIRNEIQEYDRSYKGRGYVRDASAESGN